MADFPSRVPKPIRRTLEVAIAVARDRVLDEHQRCALELVERAREDISVERIIDIYLRLHHLDEEDGKALSQRLLVGLGRDPRLKDSFAELDEEAERSRGILETPREMLGQVRRRLRGRVNAELREWIELHTGRTEMQLLRVHADHAVGFVHTLDGVLTSASAVELYQTRLKVRSALTEALYLMVLERLSRGQKGPTARPKETPKPQPHRKQRRNRGSLHVVDEAS